MATYLQATIKVRRGKLPLFDETLGAMAPALEAEGWKLLGAYVNSVGRLNEVVDLWELPDANAVASVLGALRKHPKMGKWAAALDECVEDEHVQLMIKTPYSP